MFSLVELEFRLEWSLVNVRLHTENWLCNLPGSALKVPGGGGGGGWCWWVVVVVRK